MSDKKTTVKKAPVKKSPVEKSAAKNTLVKKAAAKKSPVKKAAAKKTSVKKVAVKSAHPLIGKKAPAFKGIDQDGAPLTSAALKGKPYVLYFYPKDNTPGCTVEACDFRDEHAAFEKHGVRVIGVSPDSPKTHLGFVNKHELPFSLVADAEKILAQAYGVWQLKMNYGREYMGIVRSTFLVNSEGKISAAWEKVRVKGHVLDVLEEVSR